MHPNEKGDEWKEWTWDRDRPGFFLMTQISVNNAPIEPRRHDDDDGDRAGEKRHDLFVRP